VSSLNPKTMELCVGVISHHSYLLSQVAIAEGIFAITTAKKDCYCCCYSAAMS